METPLNMTARALLEAIVEDMEDPATETHEATLAEIAQWADRIRAIASSLAEQPAHSRAQDSGGEAWTRLEKWLGTHADSIQADAYRELTSIQRMIASEQPAKSECVRTFEGRVETIDGFRVVMLPNAEWKDDDLVVVSIKALAPRTKR